MDESAIERAKERIAQRADTAALDEVLEHTRAELEALLRETTTAAAGLTEQVEAAVKEGVSGEAKPIARQLAEVRGLLNQVIRRLERLETDAAAERHARVDDLALLVDLICSGWKSADARLGRVEALVTRLENGLQERGGAIVYRIEDRRPDVANGG
jgi:chromosome segregation ATPase